MPIYPVPYAVFNVPPSPAFTNGRIAPRPILQLALLSGQNRISCYAIVDSGADFCAFPLSFVRHLGLNPLNARVDSSAGLGSYSVPTYFWSLTIDLQGITRFDVYAGFTQGLDHWGLGLLGQSGFFDRFNVSFRLSEGIYTIEIP